MMNDQLKDVYVCCSISILKWNIDHAFNSAKTPSEIRWPPLDWTPLDVSIVFCCQIPGPVMGYFGGLALTGEEGGDASGGGKEQGATARPC